jgi:hypothetical protein
MEYAGSLLVVLGYSALGFIGLIAFVVLFGKRIETRWDFEAKFRDERGRELGEFDLELTRVAEEDSDWELETKFVLRHPALQPLAIVQVLLEGVVVLQGTVERRGHIRLDDRHRQIDIKSPAPGQICSVRVDDAELFAEPLLEG